MAHQAVDVLGEVDAGQLAGPVQLFVDERHALDAVPAVGQYLPARRVVHFGLLEAEDAGDDLQVVLDPVVNFLQERVFLLERSLDLLFVALQHGDVPADRLVLRGPALPVEDRPEAPLEPADVSFDVAAAFQHAGRLVRGQGPQQALDVAPGGGRQQVQEVLSGPGLAVHAEVAAESLVGEGRRAVDAETADELRLVLDDGVVAALAIVELLAGQVEGGQHVVDGLRQVRQLVAADDRHAAPRGRRW